MTNTCFPSGGAVQRFVAVTIALFPLAGAAGAQATPPARQAAQVSLDASGKQAVEGINAFAVDLYKHSISRERNLLVSPASVSTAIGLAYRGAKGITADELRSVMHFDALPEAYLPADAAVLASLNFAGDGQVLRVSNAVWVQQDLPLRQDFLADMTVYARAGLQRIDFGRDPDAARLAINQWVATATNNRIKELLQDGDVSADTRSELVNCIYWKGRWESPFLVPATKMEPFTALDGSATNTALMHQSEEFPVVERDGVKAIALPYQGFDVSMIVLLPDTPSALPSFEHALTAAALNSWLDELDHAAPRETALTLPKMHIEWRRDLVPALQALGAKTAFGNDADFSGMAGNDASNDAALKIGNIIHQTFIDVDELGTEAAAATAVGVEVTAARKEMSPPFVFRADKPFLFLLRDKRTNVILFMGRYVSAKQAGAM